MNLLTAKLIVVVVLGLCAAFMALNDVDGWGWFLIAAVMAGSGGGE